MDVGVVREEAFLVRVPEVRPVVDTRHFGGRPAEHLGLPGVEVGVEVDDADGAVGAVHASQEREGDGVVASEGDDSRECLSILARPFLFRVRSRRAAQDGIVAFLNLFEGVGVVVGGDGDVAAVDHRGPAVEGVRLERDVVPAAETDFV